MLPENFHVVPGTNSSQFVFVPVPVYIYVYPPYYSTQPPDFNPQHQMIEMTEQGCSIPSAQPPEYNEPNVADRERTPIQILDLDEESSEISIGGLLGDRITSHHEPVSPSETLPTVESPPESVFLPETVIPPEPLAKTEQTLIRIRDPNEGGREISIDELLGRKVTSPPQPMSLSESLPGTLSPPDSVSIFHPDLVSQHKPLAILKQTLIRIRDPNKGSREINIDELLGRRAAFSSRPVSLSESLSETVSLPESLHESVFLPECLHETVFLPESLHETVFLPKIVSPPEPMPSPESLAKTKQTLIRIRDPNEGGREICIDELLGRRVNSPLEPVLLPESSSKTVSSPELVSLPKPVSLPEPVSVPKTVFNPVFAPESLPKTVSSLETACLPKPVCLPNTQTPPDPVSVSLPSLTSTDKLQGRKVTSPPEPLSLPESLPETVSPPKPVSSPKTLSTTLPKTVCPLESVFVSLPETMFLPETVSLPKTLSPRNSLSVSQPGPLSPPMPVSLPETMSPPGPVSSPEPLANTIRTLIRIRDPKKGGREINIDELLGKRFASPPRPVSLPEFLHDTLSLPETMSLLETVPLPKILSSPKTVSPPDLLSVSLPKTEFPLDFVFAPESLPETVSSLELVSPLDSVSPAKPVFPPEPVSPPELVCPPEPLSNTEQTLERNKKSPVIRIWVFSDSDREISIDKLLGRRVTSPPEPFSPPKSLPETVSPLEPGSPPEPVFLPKTVFSPEPVPLPNTVSPPNTVYVPPEHMSPPEPVSPPKLPVNTERTLIRTWVSSDGRQEMSTNELLGRRVFSPLEPVSLPKSLPETVASPEPVAQAKYLSSLKSVYSTEPVSPPMPMSLSLPKTVFLPQIVSSTKTVSLHGPVSVSLPKTMFKPKPVSLPEAVFLSEPVYPPVSPPKSFSETVSPPKPVSNMSRCRTLTPVSLMWGDIMDALDAEQEEKKLREQKKDEKYTEQREKVEKYQLSVKSRNLPPHTPHNRHTKGVELFIRGLDLSIDKQRLYKEFLPFGDLISAKVIMKNGHSKGYGFVVYSTHMDAEAAIREMNGKTLGEKPLFVVLTPKMKSKR